MSHVRAPLGNCRIRWAAPAWCVCRHWEYLCAETKYASANVVPTVSLRNTLCCASRQVQAMTVHHSLLEKIAKLWILPTAPVHPVRNVIHRRVYRSDAYPIRRQTSRPEIAFVPHANQGGHFVQYELFLDVRHTACVLSLGTFRP